MSNCNELQESMPEDIERSFGHIKNEIQRVQEPVVTQLTELLHDLAKKSFSDPEKQEVVKSINYLLKRFGMSVVCPKTGLLGHLRLKTAGSRLKMVYEVQVRENGKYTSHFSSSTFPPLTIISVEKIDSEK